MYCTGILPNTTTVKETFTTQMDIIYSANIKSVLFMKGKEVPISLYDM